MELDDFKQDWKNAGESYPSPDYNLNELLAAQSASPLNALKAKYKKQVILLPLAAAMLGFAMTQKPVLQHNAFIWFVMPLLLLLAVMYYRDYRLVLKMGLTAADSLKSSIQENVALLEKNAKQHLYFTRALLLVLILVLEATMYYQATIAFNFWQGVSWPIRLAIYAVAVFVQPYITKFFFNLSFGRYISRLQQLLEQTA